MTIFSSPSPDITRGYLGLQFEDGANERCYKKETSSLTLMLKALFDYTVAKNSSIHIIDGVCSVQKRALQMKTLNMVAKNV